MNDPLDRYRSRVAPQPHVSIAESLLALWDRPWSTTALRFAYHALHFALSRGLDVLDARIQGEQEYFAAHECDACDELEHREH